MKHHVLSIQTPFQKLSGSPFRILILLAVLLASSIGSLMAATINVPADHATIQAAVTAATAGDIIVVAAGTYNEDVLINKSITLQGAGCEVTTISGPIGGGGATVQISAAGVIVEGFTITRAGNNTTDWNNAGLNSAGVAIQGQTVSAEIRNNKITGMRTAIDINNSNGNNIHNNVITNNHTGLIFRNQTDNTVLIENEITANRTVGVLFLDASGGTNSPVQTAANSTFNNNSISGNWYGQIVDRQAGGSLPAAGTNLKNFECNWYGTVTPIVTTANSAEPGYASLIPVVFGGTAVAPGGQPDIAGPGSANFDYIPLLTNGTDTDGTAKGFQPANGICADCSTNLPPDLFTAYPGDSRVPAGQQSATVCQNSGNVTFQFSNCIGGTVNWSGTDGSNGNGNIIASSANVGTVTYSATCTIGQCISAASQVSVTTNAPPVVSISGNTNVILGYGSNCTTLTANPIGNGPFTYVWSSGGAGVSEQVCPGATTIYQVTVTDANGCTGTASVTVFVQDVRCGPKNKYVQICYYGVTQCVPEKTAKNYLRLGATLGACGSNSPARIGVEESASDSPFELSVKGYPNPTQGDLTVEVMSKISGSVQMQVLDLTGRAVQQRSEQLLEGRNEVKFDLRAQPSGNYLIRAVDGLNRQGVVRVNKQ